ncbi:MAG: PilZ domain-containing protein [Phycisphaerae bacterium]|nr:PilZ domain-containing protein [Phycisphaerae bacterium]
MGEPASDNPADRRQYTRYDLEYTIQLISPEGDLVITGLTSNISDGGLRVPLPGECLPACGKQVQVNLTILRGGGDDAEMYNAVGTVLRHGKEDTNGLSEVALQFFSPMNLRLQSEGVDASIVL